MPTLTNLHVNPVLDLIEEYDDPLSPLFGLSRLQGNRFIQNAVWGGQPMGNAAGTFENGH